MTPENALKWLAVIEGLNDGTPSRARIVQHLKRVLRTDPDSVFEEMQNLLMMDDPTRRQAERLLRSGAVDENTRFDELPGILAVDEMEQEYRRQQKQKQ